MEAIIPDNLTNDFLRDEEIEENAFAKPWTEKNIKGWENAFDEQGNIKATLLENQRKRKLEMRNESAELVEKGLVRYLYIVLDCSSCMDDNDMKPSRRVATRQFLHEFIGAFFEENPISHLGIIAAHDKKAFKVTSLSGVPQEQKDALDDYLQNRLKIESDPFRGGQFSLKSALDYSVTLLKQVPVYGSRELLIITGALSTCDANLGTNTNVSSVNINASSSGASSLDGDVMASIAHVKRERVRVSVIALAAEVHVFRLLTHATGGQFGVSQNREHGRRLLFDHLLPSPVDKQHAAKTREWIQMGFPLRETGRLSYCSCHSELRYDGYLCRRCGSKYCSLPCDCKICGCSLVSSPSLAKTYHHLFPVAAYTEVDCMDTSASSPSASPASPSTRASTSASTSASSSSSSSSLSSSASPASAAASCFACLAPLDTDASIVVACGVCHCRFCFACDELVHTTLHNCPGCYASGLT